MVLSAADFRAAVQDPQVRAAGPTAGRLGRIVGLQSRTVDTQPRGECVDR